MRPMTTKSHHDIKTLMLGRIQSGEWGLGELIPTEKALSEDYGCARTTVNRALQALADEGLLIRKRKGGTRVCHMPVRQAKFEIPIIRDQVTADGGVYSHEIIERKLRRPGAKIRENLNLGGDAKALHLKTLHLADGEPFAFEDRWVNTLSVPAILDAPLTELSANEWLVKTVPFSSGDVAFSAVNADAEAAQALNIEAETAVFVVDRTTWIDAQFITAVRLYYNQDFKLYTKF